jgi:hypothetical protein
MTSSGDEVEKGVTESGVARKRVVVEVEVVEGMVKRMRKDVERMRKRMGLKRDNC